MKILSFTVTVTCDGIICRQNNVISHIDEHNMKNIELQKNENEA